LAKSKKQKDKETLETELDKLRKENQKLTKRMARLRKQAKRNPPAEPAEEDVAPLEDTPAGSNTACPECDNKKLTDFYTPTSHIKLCKCGYRKKIS